MPDQTTMTDEGVLGFMEFYLVPSIFLIIILICFFWIGKHIVEELL